MFVNEEKVRVEYVEVAGFATAFRGMRNPMDSWDKADSRVSEFGGENVDEKICENKYFSNYRRSDIHYFLFYCSERILYIHKFLLLFDISNILWV